MPGYEGPTTHTTHFQAGGLVAFPGGPGGGLTQLSPPPLPSPPLPLARLEMPFTRCCGLTSRHTNPPVIAIVAVVAVERQKSLQKVLVRHGALALTVKQAKQSVEIVLTSK